MEKNKPNLSNDTKSVDPDTGQTLDEIRKEGTYTEVTSIAKEEAKTGKKIPIPNGDELAARASVSLIKSRLEFNKIYSKLSSRGKMRVVNAILDLPAEDLPVCLQTDEEKKAYALGQRIQTDKMIIINHHVYKEVEKMKEQQKEKDNGKV